MRVRNGHNCALRGKSVRLHKVRVNTCYRGLAILVDMPDNLCNLGRVAKERQNLGDKLLFRNVPQVHSASVGLVNVNIRSCKYTCYK